ncbi:hlyD family secretion protein [alpha proteobacterium U9-1i]|nr:hlyD family secretion protein [alpha proteobacterium U9-1i]
MKRLLILGFAMLAAACGDRTDDTLMQGYGEADYIYLASQESGVVREILVREGDSVEAGARVFDLDADRLSLNVQGAAANRGALVQAVEAARASAALAQRNFARSTELFQQGFFSQARLDADRAARDAASAQLDQARRTLSAASAETGLARERLSDLSGAAPTAGTIERIYHRPGEVVTAGQPIAALLSPEYQKVRFFAPEALLGRLTMGAQVVLSCDGCADGLTGTISFIATEPQFTPPVIYSLDQRDKLVFLVEARLDAPGAIRPGMPVDVRLAPAP